MGKSGRKKNKVRTTTSSDASLASSPSSSNSDAGLLASHSLKAANELKEEGNRRFQSKDYAGALEHYNKALEVAPAGYADRAFFHSNKAACLMQMKPVDYNAVICECTLAIQAQPRFVRALLRRARAYEALAQHDTALEDVQTALGMDPENDDALELARKLRAALCPRLEAHQDLPSYPSSPSVGASAVRGVPIPGLGPCLPPRPFPKKLHSHTPSTASIKPEKPASLLKEPELTDVTKSIPTSVCASITCSDSSENRNVELARCASASVSVTGFRPLKLVFGHDIRLSQMPVNCSFRVLREIVAKRFASSKSVLIKYKDMEGDLVTITTTEEVRLAESCADQSSPDEIKQGPKNEESGKVGALRLYIVEVEPWQEPELVDGANVALKEDEWTKRDGGLISSPLGNNTLSRLNNGTEEQNKKIGDESKRHAESGDTEIDDWLVEFAQLFGMHMGIDSDAHVGLSELGIEFCSQALEDIVTSEEAQNILEKAASRFQEVAALALFNWGNVHMCSARKKMPLDESLSQEAAMQRLQASYDWAQERYTLAREKYEDALRIKPDFYEGLMALGQLNFERARLQWLLALASKVDLMHWDYTETIKLFDSAEEKMKAATEMWEIAEGQREYEQRHSFASKNDKFMRGTHNLSGEGSQDITAEEAAEQFTLMRSQIHLFWGNILFERSQMEFKLGLDSWKKNMDTSVERFKLAGAADDDISAVLKSHSSNQVGTNDGERKTTVGTNDGDVCGQ